MPDNVIVAILSLAGTLIGSLLGIIASNKLVDFRLKSLEDRVNKHNNLIERMYQVEDRAKSNSHRIDELEHKTHGG